MRLAISSEALPKANLKDLLEACRERGLTSLELVAGGAHGIGVRSRISPSVLGEDEGIAISGYFETRRSEAISAAGARLSAALTTPLVTPAAGIREELLIAAARVYEAEGGQLLLSSHAAGAAELARTMAGIDSRCLGISLEFYPGSDTLAGMREALGGAGPWLKLVRLHGGGPEGGSQIRAGIGYLMTALALSQYESTIVLTPSRADRLPLWEAWLHQLGGGQQRNASNSLGSAPTMPSGPMRISSAE